MYPNFGHVSLERHVSNTPVSRTEALPIYLYLCHLAAIYDGPHDRELHTSENVNKAPIMNTIYVGPVFQ